jgi:mannosyltransferase
MKWSSFLLALLGPCVILCVGFGLRLALYDIHGLEGDDGVALVLTQYDVPTLIDGLRRQELDVHPPLYFLMLKGWIALSGDSLLTLRFFNIAAEILTGAFLWALLRRSRQASYLALTLWLIAPLLLYSLYTIRMYTLMALWVTAGTWILARFIKHPTLISGIALGIICGAALMTHLYGVFLWGAAVLVIVVQIVRGRLSLKASLSGFISLALAALIFVPFGIPMLQRFLSGRSLGAQAGGSINRTEIPGQLLAAMLTHRAILPSLIGGFVLLAALTAGIAWILYRRSQKGKSARKSDDLYPFGIMLLVCGLGTAGILALAIGSSVYRPRYAVPFVPLLLGIIAVVIIAMPTRMLRGLVFLALVMVSFVGLIQNLGRNIYDDWRGAAQYIATYQQPGDVIIMIPRWGVKAFDYHNMTDLPVNGLFESVTADTDLNAIYPLIRDAERVWLVRYQVEGTDPANRAEAWTQTHGTLSTEVFPTAIQVKLYDRNPIRADLPSDATLLDVHFGDRLRLRGYSLPVTSGLAHETRLHPPSNWVQPTLYFEALQPLENVTLRVRLVDTMGGVWGSTLERSMDLLHQVPLSTWQTGQIYEVPFDLNLNPDTPPGLYRVEVMLLDASGAPLPATGANAGANWAFAGEFTVR